MRKASGAADHATIESDELRDVSARLADVAFGGAPSAAPEGRFRQLLLAVDGSRGSRPAIEWAFELAKASKAALNIVSVGPSSDLVPAVSRRSGWAGAAALMKEGEEEANAIVDATVREAKAKGLRVSGEARAGSTASEIVRAATECRADLVILGSHGHGAVERFALGSVAEGVKNATQASILIARRLPPAKAILAAVDGSRPSRAAAAVALDLARRFQLPLEVLYVEEFATGAEGAPRRLPSRAGDGVPILYALRAGEPAKEILAYAKGRADLIVMGSRGRGGLRSLVLGSVSNRVSQRAAASVLVVKSRD